MKCHRSKIMASCPLSLFCMRSEGKEQFTFSVGELRTFQIFLDFKLLILYFIHFRMPLLNILEAFESSQFNLFFYVVFELYLCHLTNVLKINLFSNPFEIFLNKLDKVTFRRIFILCVKYPLHQLCIIPF